MAGISEDVEEDDSVWRNTRARLPWLLIGVAGGLMNAKFMGLFEAELARITAIAFFTPLIQATGGNVGIQSSSLVVQSLANPDFVDEGLWKRLVKVFFVALLNGVFLSLLVLEQMFCSSANTNYHGCLVALFSVTCLLLSSARFSPY